MPSPKFLKDYDAGKLAEMLKAELVKQTDTLIEFRPLDKHDLPDYTRSIILYENGGEVNVVKVTREPVIPSIPYWDNDRAGGAIGEATLAYRIQQRLSDSPINYDVNLDKE